MDEYSIIETIQRIQGCILREIPYEFNQQALDSLSPEEKDVLLYAIEIINAQECTQQEASGALNCISFFSRIALDFEHINDMSKIYMTENILESGVDHNGEIVLWEKTNPDKLFKTTVVF